MSSKASSPPVASDPSPAASAEAYNAGMQGFRDRELHPLATGDRVRSRLTNRIGLIDHIVPRAAVGIYTYVKILWEGEDHLAGPVWAGDLERAP